MNTDDSRPGGSPPDGHRTALSSEADRLSRRQALHRLGLGVAGGAAAWAAPEILIGRPTAAGAASDAPQGRGVRPTGSGQSSSGGSVSGAAAPASGQAGADTGSSGPAAGSAASPTGAPPSDGGGAQLAFTGLNAERAVELATGLLVGGWILTRWSGRGDQNAADDPSAGPPPQPS